VIGAIALIAVAYGVVQQFRVWRIDRIAKAAKSRISELEVERDQIKWKTTRELSQRAVKASEADIKKIDKKIADLDAKKAKIRKDVNRMKPTALQQAFKDEGY